MKVFTDKKNEKALEGGIHMMHEHRGPGRHIPPHERKALMHVEFDEADWTLLKEVFGDDDTALAASEIIREKILSPSPLMGKILNTLLDEVIENPSLNEREKLIARARELVQEM